MKASRNHFLYLNEVSGIRKSEVAEEYGVFRKSENLFLEQSIF